MTYLDENEESLELGSNVKKEASVCSKPFNVTFITSVDKDGSSFVPVMAVDEVLLVECFWALWLKSEVV